MHLHPVLCAITAALLALSGIAAPADAEQAAASARAPETSLRQDYQPAPAIWRLADADTTIYLFGTVHMLPRGFRWRTGQFDRIVREVDELVLESSEEDAAAALTTLSEKMIRVTQARSATSERLAPAVREKWRILAEMTGQPFELVDSLPLTWALMGFGVGGEEDSPSSYEYGVETVLEREFLDSGRPVGSIENHGAVLLSLMRIDDGPILRDLETQLANRSEKELAGFAMQAGLIGGGAEDWSLEHAWARGEVDRNFTLGSGKAGIAFTRVLLAQRNQAWARWLESRLGRPGEILVAVGAGHFEGTQSLLHFLEQRGLAAERIN